MKRDDPMPINPMRFACADTPRDEAELDRELSRYSEWGESGGYVRKGTAKPPTSVKMQLAGEDEE